MLKVQSLVKQYPDFRSPGQRALYFMSMGYLCSPAYSEVLCDVSFSVASGESLGIIGENGAGKSTLLKIISGASLPTSGSVELNGRVSALLELGAGFYPELTGRENAYLYMRLFQDDANTEHQRLEEKIRLIEQFAELGNYFDLPLRTYSTGMQMRLAFSAASFVDPDILIVDEALAVGDAYFQQKCLDKIERFRKRGTTILFVSHSMPMIEMFCDRAICLQAGRIVARGSTTDVVRVYENSIARARGLLIDADGSGNAEERLAVHEAPALVSIDEMPRELPGESDNTEQTGLQPLPDECQTIGSVYGNGKIRFTSVTTLDQHGNIRSRFSEGDIIRVVLDYESTADYPDAVFGLSIFRIDGIYILGINNHETHPCPLPVKKGAGSAMIDIGPINLHDGIFFITTSVYTEPQAPLWPDPAEYRHKQFEFHVTSGDVPHGCVKLGAVWSPRNVEQVAS